MALQVFLLEKQSGKQDLFRNNRNVVELRGNSKYGAEREDIDEVLSIVRYVLSCHTNEVGF